MAPLRASPISARIKVKVRLSSLQVGGAATKILRKEAASARTGPP